MDAPDKALQIKAAVTACLAFGTALFGWIGWLIVIWIGCMVLDYLSGTWAALKSGTWQSTIARQGLWHKLGSIVAMLVAALCDIALGIIAENFVGIIDSAERGFLVTPVVAVWYIFTELGSVIENAGKLGAPIPAWLVRMIHKLHDKVDDAGEDMTDE